MNKNDFGNFLAKLRNDKKITQEKLGEILNVNGKTISKWECGQSIPDIEKLCDIATFFNLSLYELKNCKYIDSPFITKYDIRKIINKKSLRKLLIEKWLMMIVYFLILSSIIFCITYTINNYGKIEVYEISSVDENFEIVGYLTKTHNDSFLCINKINYIKSDKLSKSYVKNISFQLFNEKYKNEQKFIKFDKVQIFTDSLDKISFNINKKFDYHDLNSYKIVISYTDQSNNNKVIDAKIRFKKLYHNDKLKYF